MTLAQLQPVAGKSSFLQTPCLLSNALFADTVAFASRMASHMASLVLLVLPSCPLHKPRLRKPVLGARRMQATWLAHDELHQVAEHTSPPHVKQAIIVRRV